MHRCSIGLIVNGALTTKLMMMMMVVMGNTGWPKKLE